MDRLAAINVFIVVAEAGSLSAAGRRLGMPLSTVSRHLAALEGQVSCVLPGSMRSLRVNLPLPRLSYLADCMCCPS
jgi:DNA-binding transcriptional LysR family regulator